jgi:hypothetical protein
MAQATGDGLMSRGDGADLTPSKLRQFGFILAGMTAGLFGLIPGLFGTKWPLWPWMIATVLLVWAIAYPRGLRPVYQAWMRVGAVLGWINTRILLFIVYCVLIVPIGVFIRLRGGDPLARRLERGATTYRVPSREDNKGNMEAPY